MIHTQCVNIEKKISTLYWIQQAHKVTLFVRAGDPLHKIGMILHKGEYLPLFHGISKAIYFYATDPYLEGLEKREFEDLSFPRLHVHDPLYPELGIFDPESEFMLMPCYPVLSSTG